MMMMIIVVISCSVLVGYEAVVH